MKLHTVHMCKPYVSDCFEFTLSLCLVATPDVTVETSDEQLIGQSLKLECRIGRADDIYINSTFDIIWTKEPETEVRRVEKISGKLLSNYSGYYVIQTLRAGDAYTSYRCDVIINFTRPLNTSASITLENVTRKL